MSIEDWADEYEAREAARKKAGSVDGKHFTQHAERVKALRRSGDDDEAAALLLRLIEAVEREASVAGPGYFVPPWYHEHLAIIYRKAKQYGHEAAVLRRYVEFTQQIGDEPLEHLVKRLVKAQSLQRSAAQSGKATGAR